MAETVCMVSVAFAREAVSADLLTEALPLLTEHWREIATHADIPLAVDTQTYLAAGEAGVVRLFTVRLPHCKLCEAGPFDTMPRDSEFGYQPPRLVGYACFFVKPHMHYAGSVQAVQDVLYLHPSVRGGTGADFLAYCDEQLREEGVQVVHHHAKLAHPQLGKALERLGYQAVETVYSRRLDSFTESQKAWNEGRFLNSPSPAPLPANCAWSLLDFATLMRETAGMASDGDE